MKKLLLILTVLFFASCGFESKSKNQVVEEQKQDTSLPEIEVKEEDPCETVFSSTDKFTGKISDISEPIDGIYFMKTTEATSSYIHMYIYTIASYADLDVEGLVLLLENGNKISKPRAYVNVSAASEGYKYTAVFKLTKKDIKKLLESKITDTRVNVFNSEVSKGDRIIEVLKCIIEK